MEIKNGNIVGIDPLYLFMANKENETGGTVAAAEVVEKIMHKLGITSTIEELVEPYNARLPLGFPIFLTDFTSPFMSEDRSGYPERAKNVYIPWHDLLACLHEKHKYLTLSEKVCPECGEQMLVVNYFSPAWTWDSLCGRAGIVTICPNCPLQFDFALTMIN